MKTNLPCRLAALLALVAFVFPMTALADDDDKGKKRSLLEAQLTEFNGGCPPNPSEEPGGCIDVQFSEHRASHCITGPNVNIENFSIGMVRAFGDPAPLSGGSSILVRADDGIALSLSTTDLAPNAPYTVWWVGFNPDDPNDPNEDGNPCVALCNCSGDQLRPDDDSIFYATGGMTDSLGSATFSANVEYGELPAGIDQIPEFDDGAGGTISFGAPHLEGAEIHPVIRAHGKALKGKRRRGGDDDD